MRAAQACAAVTPGTTSTRDAGGLQGRHLLGGAAEDEGIAALEAGHDLAGRGLAHQDAVDLGLRGGGAARRLADEDALGVAAGVVEDLAG